MNQTATVVPIQNKLDTLAAAWMQAKATESNARDSRVAIEAQLCALVGVKDEGTTNAESGLYKVTTTGKITRSVNVDALTAISDQIPEAFMRRLIRHKAEVDTRELRFIEANEPALYRIVAQAVTSKPSKPAVKVEAL